jgi:hypothetical protein
VNITDYKQQGHEEQKAKEERKNKENKNGKLRQETD